MMLRAQTALLIGCLGAGCWPGPELGPRIELPIISNDGGNFNTDGGPGVSFRKLVAEVLEPSCAQSFCHLGNPPPAAPMSLEQGTAYTQLVNVPASQEPQLMRVKPGDPTKSYLVIKLRAMLSNDYGTTQMPLNKPPLDEAAMAAIENWIARGAPND